jgi:putative transposase
MTLVEKHVISRNHRFYDEIDELLFKSKNLYNRANYEIREKFIKNSEFLNYVNLQKIAQNMFDSYKELPAKVSQQTLKLLDQNWKSFFASIKDWSKNPSKYLGHPKLPKYLHRTKGRQVITYTNQAISKRVYLKTGLLNLSKTDIFIKSKVELSKIQQVRIVPRLGQHVIEIVYKVEVSKPIKSKNYLSIDLGLNNLATVTNNFRDKFFIINGKPLKSINQFYNKKLAEFKSKLKNSKTSNRIQKLTNKRNGKINDYLHKASRYLIDYALRFNVSTIVVGKNDGWKNEINIGKRNNQNFVQIPHSRFIEMLSYKAELVGIEVVETEESYTSKCSFLDDEPVKKHEKYAGRRIKRGLFKSAKNILINADVNGSLNIAKKIKKVVSNWIFPDEIEVSSVPYRIFL